MASAAATPARISVQRILEAVIIGVITAVGTTYVTVAVLDERVKSITSRIDRIEMQADQRVSSLQEDVRRIYTLLAQERQARRTER